MKSVWSEAGAGAGENEDRSAWGQINFEKLHGFKKQAGAGASGARGSGAGAPTSGSTNFTVLRPPDERSRRIGNIPGKFQSRNWPFRRCANPLNLPESCNWLATYGNDVGWFCAVRACCKSAQFCESDAAFHFATILFPKVEFSSQLILNT